MNNLLRFLSKYHFLILFLLLEGFSLWLLFGNSYYQRAKVGNVTRSVMAYAHSRIASARAYLNLAQANQNLIRENLALRNQVTMLSALIERESLSVRDSTTSPGYEFIPALVVNNSVNRQHNFFTINAGSNQGVEPEMGVITHNGVVGIIIGVSNNYSTAISLLNVEMRVSARLKRTHHFGSLHWDGRDNRRVNLSDIPQHVILNEGDTVVTSGFSAIFPPDVILGTIDTFHSREGNFYTIGVNLSADFSQLNNVWVVRNLAREERLKLENPIYYD